MRRLVPSLFLVLILVGACQPAGPTAPDTSSAGNPDTDPTVQAPLPTGTEIPTSLPTVEPTAEPTPGIGTVNVSSVDGMPQVYVPGGSFLMGFEDGYRDEKPEHTVTLPPFWIDRTEVTNGMYTLCVTAGACQRPRRNSSNVIDYYFIDAQYANYPVIWVSWEDAQAYCTWAGRRLPTEAEWELAARGPDGYIYPWGNLPPAENLANYDHILADTMAVGSFPAGASLYGAEDMAGNAAEWVADWYAADYYVMSPELDPAGPDSGTRRVFRGGSWTYTPDGIRASYRSFQEPDLADFETGFRCAQDANP
jgi:formylglycine-generating enzyme required for sulfatase activity